MDYGKFFSDIETASFVLAANLFATRMAFAATISDLPLAGSGDDIDVDIEEGRYRLRAAIHAEQIKFAELLELVGE